MKLATPFGRLTADALRVSRRQFPIAVREFGGLAAAALDASRRSFVRHVVVDFLRYSFRRVRPIEGETRERMIAAADWLVKAHDATGREGLSYGYFPSKAESGWRGSYPETSGYTIPTLLDAARVLANDEYRVRALETARWEVQYQMPSGATPGGGAFKQQPIGVAFNTGTVLQGFFAAWLETRDRTFLESARRAAEFLVNDVDVEGYFRSHGPFVGPSAVKTYTCLCAWPLYLVGEELDDHKFRAAAVRVGEAALKQQNALGWFARNCLRAKGQAPLLHTIGYTLQGLLELGIAARHDVFVDAVVRTADRLLPHCDGGFLPGRWYADWRPGALSSCLTGSAQFAVVCFRLAEHTGDIRFRGAADTLLNYLKALQSLDCGDPNVVGAIGGSFPLCGTYARFGFPEWATKYYLDALVCQDAFCSRDADGPAANAVDAPLAPRPFATVRTRTPAR
jgi:hypothetical protein